MAARRLAISSLLCSDDAQGPGPSTIPTPSPTKQLLASPETVILAPHLLRPRPPPDPAPYDRRPTQSSPRPFPAREFIPLSLQSDVLRRHTPSPDRRLYTDDDERPTASLPSPRTVHRYDRLPADGPEAGQHDLRRLSTSSPYSLPHAHAPFHSPRPSLDHSPPTSLAFPRPPPATSPSPSLSLASLHSSSSHRPPSTPSAYSHRASASPVIYYNPAHSPPLPSSHHRPPSQHQPHRQQHQQHQQQQHQQQQYQQQQQHPQTTPQPSPYFAHPSQHHPDPATHFSATHRPPSSSSSSSFPSALLNPVSPSMPSSLNGLEGFEALVQVATEERRRISAEGLSSSLDRERERERERQREYRKPEGFRTSASRSPEVVYRPLEHGPHTHGHRPSFTVPPAAAASQVPLTPMSLSVPAASASHATHPRPTSDRSGPEHGTEHRPDPLLHPPPPDTRPHKRRRRSGSHPPPGPVHEHVPSPDPPPPVVVAVVESRERTPPAPVPVLVPVAPPPRKNALSLLLSPVPPEDVPTKPEPTEPPSSSASSASAEVPPQPLSPKAKILHQVHQVPQGEGDASRGHASKSEHRSGLSQLEKRQSPTRPTSDVHPATALGIVKDHEIEVHAVVREAGVQPERIKVKERVGEREKDTKKEPAPVQRSRTSSPKILKPTQEDVGGVAHTAPVAEAPNGPSMATKQKPRQTPPQEQDAHEWLLEHFDEVVPTPTPPPATPSPPIRSPPLEAQVPVPSATPPRRTPVPSPPPAPPAPAPEPVSEPAYVPMAVDETDSELMAIARTSVSAERSLEQEIEEVAGVSEVAPKPKAKVEAMDMETDVDSELALAAAVTPPERRPVTPAAGADVEMGTVADVDMDADVDAELLSLIEDTQPPRSSHAASAHAPTHTPALSASISASTSTLSSGSHRSRQDHHLKHAQAHTHTHPHGQPSKRETGMSFPPATLHPSLPSRSASAAPVKSERESMPPPPTTVSASISREYETDAGSERARTPRGEEKGASAKKKPAPKARKAPAAPKARAKPSGTAKSKTAKDGVAAAARGKKGSPLSIPPQNAAKKSSAAARSRSTSVMPRASAGPDSQALAERAEDKEDEQDEAEDKLYCVCKTRYDDERVMIACDRCDEWYHTQCVGMPDLEVDLVDQFICPPCVDKSPELSLHTTWKRRCQYGLAQQDPASAEACHRPARGAFSKYCSDECGLKCMQMRIGAWARSGGAVGDLWESVKMAERREGVVVSTLLAQEQKQLAPSVDEMQVDGGAHEKSAVPKANGNATAITNVHTVDTSPILGIVKPQKPMRERELERLNAQLGAVVEKREAMKKAMEVVVWRERLTELAVQRSEGLDECGWDQRLCFGDEEIAEFGAGVLESYEEESQAQESEAMQVDGAAEQGEWWCRGKSKCDRHDGWQKLRLTEVRFDKDVKEQALQKLTTREREIRKRIEDIVDPQARLSTAAANNAVAAAQYTAPLRNSNATAISNGQAKTKINGDTGKKGKKRKSEA